MLKLASDDYYTTNKTYRLCKSFSHTFVLMKFAWKLKIYKGLCRGGTVQSLGTLPWEQLIRQWPRQVKSVCLQLLHEAAYHFSICIQQGERQCTPLNIRHTGAFCTPASYFTLGCFAWDERVKFQGFFVHNKPSLIFLLGPFKDR